MYIKKDFLSLTQDELADYTARGFALCYVERCDRLDIKGEDDYNTHYGFRLFFTEADLKEQWGDDWNDAPYDLNAGWPYDDTSHKDADGKWQHKKHTILVLNVTYEEHCPTVPADYGYNSPFCVEAINQGAVAWLFIGKECKAIQAGDTPLDVFERTAKWMGQCPEISEEYDEG